MTAQDADGDAPECLPEQTFPGPVAAAALTIAGWSATFVLFQLAIRRVSPDVAMPIAVALGLGGVFALGLLAMPAPRAPRLGVRGCPPAGLAIALLMVPVLFLGTELANLVRSAWPPPDAVEMAKQAREQFATETPRQAASAIVSIVLLAPLAEELFFRGFLQQGLVHRLGKLGGVGTTALLFAGAHATVAISLEGFASIAAATLCYGVAFGAVRLASRSVWASMLTHAGANALGLLGVSFAHALPIPGFSAHGAHIPLVVLAPAALSVAAGLSWSIRRS